MEANKEIDLSGMRCPLPVLRTKKALGELAAGEVLRVTTTDPDSCEDIPAFARMAGHALERAVCPDGGDGGGEGDSFVFYIRKQ